MAALFQHEGCRIFYSPACSLILKLFKPCRSSRRTFVLVAFLFPYVLHLPCSPDVSASILISSCTWIQEAALESNQVKPLCSPWREKKYQVSIFLANRYRKHTLLMCLLKIWEFMYTFAWYIQIQPHRHLHTTLYTLWLPVYILVQEHHWTNTGWYWPHSYCIFMNSLLTRFGNRKKLKEAQAVIWGFIFKGTFELGLQVCFKKSKWERKQRKG